MKRREKKLKEIPSFLNEDEEREFWSKHSSTEFIDWSDAKEAKFPNLKSNASKKKTETKKKH